MQILCGIYFNEEDWITDFRASVKETELLDMAESGTFFASFLNRPLTEPSGMLHAIRCRQIIPPKKNSSSKNR